MCPGSGTRVPVCILRDPPGTIILQNKKRKPSNLLCRHPSLSFCSGSGRSGTAGIPRLRSVSFTSFRQCPESSGFSRSANMPLQMDMWKVRRGIHETSAGNVVSQLIVDKAMEEMNGRCKASPPLFFPLSGAQVLTSTARTSILLCRLV